MRLSYQLSIIPLVLITMLSPLIEIVYANPSFTHENFQKEKYAQAWEVLEDGVNELEILLEKEKVESIHSTTEKIDHAILTIRYSVGKLVTQDDIRRNDELKRLSTLIWSLHIVSDNERPDHIKLRVDTIRKTMAVIKDLYKEE